MNTNRRWQITEKSWETEFLGQRVGALRLGGSLESVGYQTVELACATADSEGFELLECHLDTREWAEIGALEAERFHLVDSRAEFVTHMRLSEIEMIGSKRGSIRNAVSQDRSRVIELTHEGLTYNDEFHSRFKDRRFFDADVARRWFEAWIDYTLLGAESRSAVFEIDGRVEGYYIYRCEDHTANRPPLYKGILTAVSPSARGSRAQLAMQEHLYVEFDCPEWFVENTTQISNIPVINNHIRANKVLDRTVLTYYRSRSRELC